MTQDDAHEQARDAAQRWHEDRVAADPEHEQFSECFCCCLSCDPAWEPPEPNPYFQQAMRP